MANIDISQTTYQEHAVGDLMDYFGLSKPQVMEKLTNGFALVRDEYLAAKANGLSDREFYATSELYPFDQIKWNVFSSEFQRKNKIAEKARGRTLDYGGGTGDLSLLSFYNGDRTTSVTYYDVPGKTFDFAKWRLNKYWGGWEFVDGSDTEDKLDGKYDTVFCIDVLEHLDDPKMHLTRMRDHLAPVGKIYAYANFGKSDTHPMHQHGDMSLSSLVEELEMGDVLVDVYDQL